MISRRIYVAVLGVLAVPLTAVSLAWACVPRGTVAVDPANAPSGSTVMVTATGFPREIPAVVRWNGISGQRLGGGVGPNFTAEVTVPRVAAGSYVISVSTDDEHASHSEGKIAFEITGSGTAPTPAPGGSNTNPAPMNPFAPAPAAGGKVITGTAGADRLVGTSGRDVIRCGGGSDTVIASGGNDFIDCGGGNDRVNGGAGNDEIRGGAGNDNLTGGAGADDLNGGPGIDTLRGNGGRDRLSGAAGRDTLWADSADRIVRGPGDRIHR